MIHAHVTSWTLALILFFISFALYKVGKQKAAKIVSMVLRLVYILILLTGIMIFTMYTMHLLKAAAGIWVIGSMEMVLMKVARKEKATGPWLQFVIALVLTLYLGFSI